MSQFNYFRYVSNGAANFALKTLTDVAAAAGLGFGAASAADPAPPKGFRPRKVYLMDAVTGRRRAEPVATPTAYAAMVGQAATVHTVSLPDRSSAAATVFNVVGGRDEGFRVPHLIH